MPSSLRRPTGRIRLRSGAEVRAVRLGVVGLTGRATPSVERVGRRLLPVPSSIDAGASDTPVGLAWANRWHIPAPPDGAEEFDLPPVTAGGRGPLRVRPGRFDAWWNEGAAGHRFSWPILFVPGRAIDARPPLGLVGVVKTGRWTIDGTCAPAAPWGRLTLDDLR